MSTGKAGTDTISGFHLPSLDGIRAVAALMVFVSHAGYGHVIPGGFGVTVFFFLSGYLITTLLRREFERGGTINFRAFYLRRIYRILPPMYTVIAVIVCVYAVVGFGTSVSGTYIASLLLQFNNYYTLYNGDAGVLPATGPFWSLAVEEHFYLIFPALFVFAWRRWPGAGVARLFIGLCLAVLVWRYVLILGMHAAWERTYVATDTRLDSMLFGCIMGVWMNPALDADPFRSRTAKVAWLGMGVALLLAGFVIRDPDFRATLRYTVQGLGLFPVFWLAVRHPDWPIFRILNTAPMRWLGVLSYSFYLSHAMWLDMAARLTGRHGAPTAVVAFVLTVAFAWCVYRVVEVPFARLRRRLHDREAAAAAGPDGQKVRAA